MDALHLQSAQALAGCSQLRFVDLSHNALTSTQGLEGDLPSTGAPVTLWCYARLLLLSWLGAWSLAELFTRGAGEFQVQVGQGALPNVCHVGLALLTELRLAGNRLTKVTDVRTLAVLPTLQRLTLAGNPVVDGMIPRAAAVLLRNACPGARTATHLQARRNICEHCTSCRTAVLSAAATTG